MPCAWNDTKKEVAISFQEQSSYLQVEGHFLHWQKTLSRDNGELSERDKTVKHSTTEGNWSAGRSSYKQTVLGQR